MTATAFAAYGWVEQARAAMAAAQRGPAWDAALEHRLFLDAMLLTFEGDLDGARDQALRLERLPLPPAGGAVRDRVVTFRLAVGALARAFAHASNPGDRALMERASESSPLVFWAMRYAGAVAAIDQGDPDHALRLIHGAPRWPTESSFRAFHREIIRQAFPGGELLLENARRAAEESAAEEIGSETESRSGSGSGSDPAPPANAP